MPYKDPEERRRKQKEYNRNRYNNDPEYRAKHLALVEKRKSEQSKWWMEYKKTLKCNRCEESYYACLQFHHTDPTVKEESISQIVRHWGKDRIMKEVAKCEVLCANCHCKEHYPE